MMTIPTECPTIHHQVRVKLYSTLHCRLRISLIVFDVRDVATQDRFSNLIANEGQDPEIKREAQSILDSLDFSEPTITQPLPNAQQIEDTSPHGLNGSASKRPLDEADDGRESPSSAAKRVKLEGREPETETSFEDGLALLVQNALSSVEDMSGQLETLPTSFDEQDQLPVAETTETDDAPVQPAPEEHIQRPPTPKPALPTTVFSSDPEKYVREANMRALGHLVRPIACYPLELCLLTK